MAGPSPPSLSYTYGERNSVIVLVASGLISLASVLTLLLLMIFKSKRYRLPQTHFQLYFVCLLLANTMQAWGTTMNLKWVEHYGVEDGSFCAAQGGIKQGGDIAAAIWSYIISFHLFNLLFLRYQTSQTFSWGMVVFGWCFTFFIVFLGPVVIQTVDKGHYFGISGLWCWISDAYRIEQIMLDYFFQLLSFTIGIFFHTATLLRVRGNLLRVDGHWRFRWVPPGQSWQLALGRDFTDSSMLRLAKHMVWYPVAYAATIFPEGILLLFALCGNPVPLWAFTFTGFIFNLSGFVNVMLFLGAHHYYPVEGAIPQFSAQRDKHVDAIVAQHGVVPFLLRRSTVESEDEEKAIAVAL